MRWVGNEEGIAGDPCWATLTSGGMLPGLADAEVLNRGMRDGSEWLPAECDVSIRPGWFYHPAEDGQVKTPEQLMDLYFRSVGRGASLLINLPPDRRGRIHAADAAALAGFRQLREAAFGVNLAAGARATLPAAAVVTDGNADTYWHPSPDDRAPYELALELRSAATFNVIGLREYLPLGQRVDEFAVEAEVDGAWVELGRATSIGSLRLLRVETTTAARLRLRVLAASAPPALSELALYSPS